MSACNQSRAIATRHGQPLTKKKASFNVNCVAGLQFATMAKTAYRIGEPTLRELAEASSLSGVLAVGQHGGFALTVTYGATDAQRLLASARGETRLFSNLTTLASFLKKLGIDRFEVDTSTYSPGRVRPPRPDRAMALRQTKTRLHQATLELV